jgi:protein-S-isoprenylcysteine O-methyltransferase Ste14
MRRLDWPPVWLAGFIGLAWLVDHMVPWGIFGPGAALVGLMLILGGLALMAAAVFEMMRRRTTIIPRRAPDALVTRGVFRWTRNPIYLGDALVLAGIILRWDVPLAVPLVPLFMMVIQHRFILGEERRLAEAFGSGFTQWARNVRRWV